MNPSSPLLALLLLVSAGCAPADSELGMIWQGYIFNDIPGSETAVFSSAVMADASVVLTETDGTPIHSGTESDSSPGLWQIEIEPDKEVGLRLSGLAIHPTVWRVHTPPTTSFWFNGSLFGVGVANLDQVLNLVEQLKGEAIPWRDAPEGVLIYGQPIIQTAADLGAWTGASITALDSNYHEGQVALLTVTETGTAALASDFDAVLGPNDAVGPVQVIVAWDLEPGPIRLIIDASDGRSMVMDWVGEDGDVLSAFQLVLPSVNQ